MTKRKHPNMSGCPRCGGRLTTISGLRSCESCGPLGMFSPGTYSGRVSVRDQHSREYDHEAQGAQLRGRRDRPLPF